MNAIVATFAALWAAALIAPATPLGRAIAAMIVDRPARMLAAIRRGHVALVTLLAVGAAGLVWLIGEESARLMAMAAPEVASWAVMFEVTTLLDVTIAAVTTASMLSLRGIAARLRPGARLHRPRRRGTAATRPPAANDDEDGRAVALAA